MTYIKRHFWPYVFGKEIETVTRMKSQDQRITCYLLVDQNCRFLGRLSSHSSSG